MHSVSQTLEEVLDLFPVVARGLTSKRGKETSRGIDLRHWGHQPADITYVDPESIRHLK